MESAAHRLPLAPASRWRVAFLVSAGVFVALALLVGASGFVPGERELFHALTASASPDAVSIFRGINYLGDKRVLLPATLLLLWVAPTGARRHWWLWAGVMVAAPVLEGLMKGVIGRPRPLGHSFGFPSGHATAAAAYFFLAAYLLGKRLGEARRQVILLWLASAVIVALAATARIMLQAHWPGDVLGGAALGLACVAFAAWWHERRA